MIQKKGFWRKKTAPQLTSENSHNTNTKYNTTICYLRVHSERTI